jgi:Amt family ammonium transporter
MLETEVNTGWILISAMLVFFMQAGFAMLEVGSVRSKNAQNILLKNVLDVCVSGLCWILLGFGFAFGESAGNFIGGSKFGTVIAKDDYTNCFFQWAFASTAATIVSGSLAERTQFSAYVIYSIFITCFVYPVVVHWTWGGGWLTQLGFQDFAGSCIVHTVGGVAGLVGASVIGPRDGKFTAGREHEFKPHNVPSVILGMFILWFGWYGFNAGSTVSLVEGNHIVASKICVNTTMAAIASGIVSFLLKKRVHGYTNPIYDLNALTNGILAGLVSITAPCSNVEVYSSLIIGAIGGIVYVLSSHLLNKMHVDDPLEAFPVHGACGIWGTFALGLFDESVGVFYGNNGEQLGHQCIGIVAITAWTSILCFVLFNSLKRCDKLRVDRVVEEMGMDAYYHGGEAYNIKDGEPASTSI